MSAKLWAVVRREYVERVRTKGFLIGTILGPLLMSALMIVPLIVARAGGKLLAVAVLDRTGTVGPAVEKALRDARSDGKPRFDVRPADGDSGPARRRRRCGRPCWPGSSTATSSFPRTPSRGARSATTAAT